MKLRIKGDSLRLRLSQSEIQEFESSGMVSDTIHFGPTHESKITYSLVSVDSIAMGVRFDKKKIEIYIPHVESKIWTSTDQVSLEANIEVGENRKLNLLVEKDFQCLHKRPNEDESDNYPNPLATDKMN